jgi:hypothetical protein
VAELGGGSICWNDDTTLEEFEEPPNPLRNETPGGICLLEMKVGAIEDEGDPIVQRVVELHFEKLVGFLSEECSPFCKSFHLWVVIDIKMFSLKDVPLKISVLHFVTTEIEELCVALCCWENKKKEDHPEGMSFHRRPVNTKSWKEIAGWL